MVTKIIEDTFNPEIYNEKAVHPMQSWEWGEAKKKLGNHVLRIGEFENDTLKNVFQLTFHPIPKTGYKVGYLPKSVIPSQSTSNFLLDYGKKHKVIFIKLEPNIKKSESKVNSKIFAKSAHPLFPAWTQMLDLRLSVDELFKNLKSKTRYNIRLAEKKGVTINEESNNTGFKTFSKLYFETTKRQRYFGHDLHYHKTIWQYMKDQKAFILTAYFENTPLASYELFYFNKVLYYPYGGSSEMHRNLMGANLLMWESIKLGKKLGAEFYDMWGSLPPTYDPKDPWAGFTRFKEGYNTEFVEFVGSYDLVINTPLYAFYNLAYKMRTLFLKLKA